MARLDHSIDSATAPVLTQCEEVSRFRVSLVREPGFAYPQPADFSNPASIAASVWEILHDADREHFGAIYLDIRNKMIGYQIAFIGTLTGAAVEPRGVFSAALLCNAAKLIIFHCHPSGDPSPSQDDINFTKRMTRAGEFLGIPVMDHVIVGEEHRWFSFRQKGML